MKQDERKAPGRLYRVFPFLDWLKGYQLETFKDDSIAGITVAVVLIPQAMAYAMLAGMPAVYGLYAAAVTPFIAALWGSLRQLATGPIAIMSLLVLTTLSSMAEPGSREFIEFLNKLDTSYPQSWKIRLVLDNHSSHISKETQRYLRSKPGRFDFVFTPKHGSWLNLIETYFSKIARSFLRHGSF